MVTTVRRTLLCAVSMSTCFLLAAGPLRAAGPVDAKAAFARLKTLAGTWHATPEAKDIPQEHQEEMGETAHEFRLSAAGTVVMETMAAGTDHEMINMYHLDGDDLLVTHYCAEGNQPRMRLDREHSTDSELVFDFIDATNLGPTDSHIHSIRIAFGDHGRVDSAWTGYQNGKPAGVMTFHLAR